MAKAFRRAEREAAKEHDRRSSRGGPAYAAALRIYAPLWLEPPKPEDPRRRPPRIPARSAPATSASSPSRRCIATTTRCATTCGDFNYAKREQTADLARPLCARHRRPRQDRLSGIFETSAGRRACHRHHPLSRRRGRPLLEGAGFCGVFASACEIHGLDLRHTPSVELFTRFLRAAAAAGLHSEQCLPDRAPAGRIFPAPARRGSRIRWPRFPCVAQRRSRVTRSCGALSRDLAGARRGHPHRDGRDIARRRGAAAQRGAVAAALSRRGLSRRRGAVPRGPLRRGPAAGRPARDQQLAAAHARGRDARAARSAAGERHRALHPQLRA